MIESPDYGDTWEFKGYAQFYTPDIIPVDPSALFDNGELNLYFLDLLSLMADTAVVYRTVATDDTGLDFTLPTKAFKFAGFMTDPAVVKMPSGLYRMYVHGPTAILSATSPDGHNFSLDAGERTTTGGVPGALVLPDGRIRLFVCGAGITSLISDDGLTFVQEPDIRIPIPPEAFIVADPHPIKVTDDTYRMAYKVKPEEIETPENDQIYLSESVDGYTWVSGSSQLVKGSVPTLVELPDGRWRIYYVEFRQTQNLPAIWSGADETFTKENYADWNLPANQDRITDNVWLTRRNQQGLINIKTETGSYNFTDSPEDTEWAFSNIMGNPTFLYGNGAPIYASLTFYPSFDDALNDKVGDYILDRPGVVYLVTDNIYIDIIFSSWTLGTNWGGPGGGGFSYTRKSDQTAIETAPGSYLPETTRLHHPFPNPFNPHTMIVFEVSQPGFVELKVYNVTGQEMETLFSGHHEANQHDVVWDAKDFPSGIYILQLRVGDFVEVRKLILQK